VVIVYNRSMCQTYRSIVPLIDSIIEVGHELVVQVYDRRLDFDKYTHDHHDIKRSSPECLSRMARNFGVKIRHLDVVRYTRKDHPTADLYLNYVCSRIRGCLPPKTLGIPFHKHVSLVPSGEVVTGNPLSEAFNNAPYEEIPGSVLILHVGGARGYISRLGSKTKEHKVWAKNKEIMRRILDGLSFASRIVVKAHPVPYHGCTKKDMEEQFGDRATIVDDDMIRYVKESEYIIGFGTSAWTLLGGSGKKLIDLVGASGFGHNREGRFGENSTGVCIEELHNLPEMDGLRSVSGREQFELLAVENIMDLIRSKAWL